MSNLAALPQIAPTFRLIQGEGWLDAVVYLDADGAPLPLDGIAFDLVVIPRGGSEVALEATSGAGTILVVGNMLSLAVPASALAALAPGAYRVLMKGLAGGRARTLFNGRLSMVAP